MGSSEAMTSRKETMEASVAVPASGTKWKPNLWPSFQHHVELRSGKTCFVEAGRGFPVVLLHGLMGYSFSWRKNIPALAEHFRVLALDLAGCGHSGPLQEGKYGVEAWSRQLEEFLDARELRQAHLVATSAGGAVALDFASRCPERVGKMVLAAPVNPFSRRVRCVSTICAWTGLPTPLLKMLLGMAPKLLPWFFRHRYYTDAARLTPETVPGYLQGIRREITAPMLREAIASWNPDGLARRISRVSAPTLLLWGQKDNQVPPACIPRLLAALPNASVVTIPRTGHFCYEELPEAFNEAVLRFFQKAPEAG